MTYRFAAVSTFLFLTACSPSGLPSFGWSAPKKDASDLTAGFKEPYVLASGGAPICQRLVDAESRAKAFVVLIRTRFSTSGSQQFGAGVIVAVRDNAIYVVTARHVVHQERGGKAVVEVAFGADEKRYAPAAVVPAKPKPSGEPLSDLAVVQVDARAAPTDASTGLNWAVVRHQTNVFDLKDVAVIGNPGARGKTVTPPGPAQFASSYELRVNSGVMEQGYSGGGAFDRQWRLVGIVYEDRGSFAAAYPIEPVLKLVGGMGVPVDLTAAASSKKGIHLARVSGEPDALRSSVSSAVRDVLQRGGYEPDCDTPDAHKLTMTVAVRPASLSTSVAEIQSVFVGPTGAQLATERQQLHYQNVWGTAEAIEARVKPAAQELVQKLAKVVQ